MAGGSRGREIRDLIRELRAQGFTVDDDRTHPIVRDKAGEFVTTLARTPSEYRGWKNAIARCHAHGFVWQGR